MEEISAEEEILFKIKLVLSCGNDAQAVRLLEQYGQWQQKRSYSEEEVLDILKKRDLHNIINIGDNNTWIDISKWFEEFKKK